MTSTPSTRLLLFCLFAAHLLCAPGLLRAGTIQFPKDNPAFEAKLPTGWTAKWTPNGGNEGDNLELDPGDGSEYALMFSSVHEAKDMTELKKKLPSFIEMLVKTANVQPSVTGEIKDTLDVQHGFTFAQLEAHGTGAAEGYTVTVCGFKPLNGDCFIIAIIASKQGTQAHQKDYATIRDSIRRLR